MKKLIFVIVATLVCACTHESPSKTLIEPNRSSKFWDKFPIVLHTDQTATSYRSVIEEEIKALNLELGFMAVVLAKDVVNPADFSKEVHLNVISFGNSGERGLSFYPSEQAKTSVFWRGRVIQNANMKFNLSMMTNLDFATLFRHELGHFLGMRHMDHQDHIMNPHLPSGTSRSWGIALTDWKEDMQSVGVLSKDTTLASTSP